MFGQGSYTKGSNALDTGWQEETGQTKRHSDGKGAKRPTLDMGHSYHKSTGPGGIGESLWRTYAPLGADED